jgi:hypothetical protein
MLFLPAALLFLFFSNHKSKEMVMPLFLASLPFLLSYTSFEQ